MNSDPLSGAQKTRLDAFNYTPVGMVQLSLIIITNCARLGSASTVVVGGVGEVAGVTVTETLLIKPFLLEILPQYNDRPTNKTIILSL